MLDRGSEFVGEDTAERQPGVLGEGILERPLTAGVLDPPAPARLEQGELGGSAYLPQLAARLLPECLFAPRL